jgi:hypothetical protein
MPHLLTFVPCEKVIISELDHASSLINILETLTIAIAKGTTVPSSAIVPLQWHVFSMWRFDPDEVDKNYEQRVYLALPDGQQPVEAVTAFTPTEKTHRNITQFSNFPVGQTGDLYVSLALREAGQTDWREVAKYPLTVVHAEQAEQDITPTA